MLATSLQPLGAMGETTRRVPPLTLPTADDQSLESLRTSEAVLLFEARVGAHLPGFAVDAQNAQVVAEICRQLDGLPLALELVSARVESLGIAEIAARLSDRFALAVGASRTTPARQRTLEATLEWSWSLLDDDERALLRRVGIFARGGTLAAAEAVCGGDGLAESSIFDALGRLVTKSLVVADHDELTVRYRLLETVRAYAQRQLTVASETRVLQRRHAAYMVRLVEGISPQSSDGAQASLLMAEEDNLRAALEWAIQHEQANLGLRLASHAFILWFFTGHYLEGTAWLDRLLALGAGQRPTRSLPGVGRQRSAAPDAGRLCPGRGALRDGAGGAANARRRLRLTSPTRCWAMWHCSAETSRGPMRSTPTRPGESAKWAACNVASNLLQLGLTGGRVR